LVYYTFELDQEHIFSSATDDVPESGTATVTVTITNKLEFSDATLTGCVVVGAAACKSCRKILKSVSLSKYQGGNLTLNMLKE